MTRVLIFDGNNPLPNQGMLFIIRIRNKNGRPKGKPGARTMTNFAAWMKMSAKMEDQNKVQR